MSGPKLVIELDAPGAGNWQGACRNEATGEWFLLEKTDAKVVYLYRFDRAGKYQDKMTCKPCEATTAFGVSDSNVIWLTWNDAASNDVVTFDYRAGATITKADTTPMHVFSTGNLQISFDPSRNWAALRRIRSATEEYRKVAKQDILDNVDRQSGKTVTIKRDDKRVVQGFSVVGDELRIIIGLHSAGSAFRHEVWSFETGKMLSETPIDGSFGLRPGETGKTEPEGRDGKFYGMKVGQSSKRRLAIYED